MRPNEVGDEGRYRKRPPATHLSEKGSLIIVVGKAKKEVSLDGIEFDQRSRSLRGKPDDERDELERQRDLLVAATESALDAVMVTGPKGHIQYVNPAFERGIRAVLPVALSLPEQPRRI